MEALCILIGYFTDAENSKQYFYDPHKTYQFSFSAPRLLRLWRCRSANKQGKLQISGLFFTNKTTSDGHVKQSHDQIQTVCPKSSFLTSSMVWLASINMSFMQWKTHWVKQPPALIKAFCPTFHSLHGNYAAAPKHRRHRTKQEADCPPPHTHTHPIHVSHPPAEPLHSAGPAAGLQRVEYS